MICEVPRPIFPNENFIGIKDCLPYPDGYSIFINFAQALQNYSTDQIGYNIYFSSTNKEDVLTEGAKYFTTNLELTIRRFSPGTVVWFIERATEYNPLYQNPLNFRPAVETQDAYVYPQTLLASNINEYTTIIPLVDASDFPPYGILQIGTELMYYPNVDYVNNLVYNVDRGFYNTNIRYHNVDGYDGYHTQNPVVFHFAGFEDLNLIYSQAETRFEPPEFPFTETDGYKSVSVDLLNTNLSASDDLMQDSPLYDYSGYHRTSMVDFFSGICIGSYHGGSYGCNGQNIRGLSLSDHVNQRLELMLEIDGEPVILLRRLWTGIKCNCYRLNQEHYEGRCASCFGTSFVGGYDQFYNPKRSDSKILVRFSPTVDDLAIKQFGLQQNFAPAAWTLVYPAIKDRDVLIRFNQDLELEYFYEVTGVTRNKLMFGLSGAQAMNLVRLDKTDPVYQWRAIKSTSLYKGELNTGMSVLRGHGPHIHVVTINNFINTLEQINSTTSVVSGHNHPIINGVVQEMLGHTHSLSIY